MMPHQATVRSAAESEAENPDNQQVQVIVHRSVSFNHEDSESVRTTQADENCEFYINKYTTEGTDMVVSGLGRNDPDDVIVLTEVTEIQNEGGYPTVVAHIVSKMASDKESSSKSKASNKGTKEGNYDQSAGKTDLPGQAVMKRKHRDNTSDNSVVGDRSAGAETFSADGILKKNGITEDIPSCSWENLSEGGKVHSGHGDLESCQEANSSEAKSGSLANSEDADSTKSSNNGCFGNIFSRRIQAPLPNVEFPAAGKTQIPNFQKKSLSYKAATWEKCHRDYVQSVLKSSPLDPVKDFNNLTSVMQKSPVSSFDVMDIFNSDMKCLQRDVAKHGRKPSGSFNPDKDLSDIVSCATLGNNSEESECATSRDKSDELIQISEDPVDHDFHTGGCYISPCSEITHL